MSASSGNGRASACVLNGASQTSSTAVVEEETVGEVNHDSVGGVQRGVGANDYDECVSRTVANCFIGSGDIDFQGPAFSDVGSEEDS